MTCITIQEKTIWLDKLAFGHILNNITPIVNDDEWVGGSRALEQMDINDLPQNVHQKVRALCNDDVLKPFKDELLVALG
ncbi:hypothetical protein LP109_13485 [Moraxella bovis]|uniref:hypothetical protein n=1 Tax=Moraxella bovis TaxID=476 RepID=UPI0022277CA2|nr:hypothetical protein [Moraxella bovis]UZA16602.1 hypothetical protein LP109_13485 [Moraxella bovis]